MISTCSPAHAASPPHAAGQITPRPAARAAIAAGSTPGTRDSEPSSASSPSATKPARLSRGDHAHGGQQAERDRQVVVAAFLGEVGRREIDGDALRRQRQARARGTPPAPARGFRRPPCRPGRRWRRPRLPGAIITCTSTGTHIDALESYRLHPCLHDPS